MALLYKPLSLLISVLGGRLIAGLLVKQVWKRVAGQDDAPDPDDQNYTWRQVLLAGLLQGAVFGLVKAVIQRAGAHGVLKTTGRWPGEDRREIANAPGHERTRRRRRPAGQTGTLRPRSAGWPGLRTGRAEARVSR